MTEEQRAKRKGNQWARGHVISEEGRAKLSAVVSKRMIGNRLRRGKTASEETRAKMKTSHRTTNTPEQRAKNSAAMKGRPSPMLGKRLKEGTKALISKKMTDRLRAGVYRIIDAVLGGKSYHFRSGWEKKAAEWMTVQRWDWRYEEKSYAVSTWHYVPDFHIYQGTQLWKIVEVKGHYFRDAKSRLVQFQQQYPSLPFEIWDGPELKRLGIL